MSGVYQELGDRSGPGIMPHAAAISCCSKGSAWEAWLGTVLALFFQGFGGKWGYPQAIMAIEHLFVDVGFRWF